MSGSEIDPDTVAAGWYARLRARPMSEAEHRALADWRLADSANAAAWATVDTLWQDLGVIADDPAVMAMRAVIQASVPKPALVPRPLRWLPYAGVATAAALIVAILTNLPSALDAPTASVAYAEPRELATARGQRMRVELVDGSQITLAPQSRVRIGPWDGERRVTLTRGEAQFGVAHATLQFVVHADRASVTAVGTVFTVARDGGDVRTILEQGRIRVVPDAGSRKGGMALDAGHAITIRDGRIVATGMVDSVAETSWLRGELVFADTPLSVAISRYNRYATRPIRLTDDRLAVIPVTGRFRIGGRSGFVDMIVAAGLVRIVRDGADGIVVTAPKK